MKKTKAKILWAAIGAAALYAVQYVTSHKKPTGLPVTEDAQKTTFVGPVDPV